MTRNRPNKLPVMSSHPAIQQARPITGPQMHLIVTWITSTRYLCSGVLKKNIISKNFRGGEIVNIMGGADINLMQADIQGPVVLEVVQIFGGTKIIVPAHWKVHPEMAAVFGGVEDQRFTYTTAPDDTRTLYIKGTSIFGGNTIKSM